VSEEQIQAGSVSGKPIYVSKTMIAAGLTAIAPYIPYVRDWVQADPTSAMTVAGILFAVLRLVSTKKLEWKIKF